MTTDGELWHIVEARRDDGTPTMFRIRELDPRKQLTKIFVVELPYPKTELSRLPNATDYRRLSELDEQWLRPASTALGWEVVGVKIEDGSFFLYMYGAGDPNTMIEKLSPFDAGLGFYDDEDPEWQEYRTLRDLLDQARAMPDTQAAPTTHRQRAATTAITNKPAANATPALAPTPQVSATRPKPTARAKGKATPKAKLAAKAKAKAKAKPAAKARPPAKKPVTRAKARSVARVAKTKTKSKPRPVARVAKRKRR